LIQTNQPVANTPATCPAAIKRSPILLDAGTLITFDTIRADKCSPPGLTMSP
jgi:hypothetical protein